MDLKTTAKNLNDPARYRPLNLSLNAAILAMCANKYRKERTVWNLLPLVRGAILMVEVAFRPGKDNIE